MGPLRKRTGLDRPEIQESLLQRIVRLDGEITDDSARDVIAQLLFLQAEDRKRPITLLIDSLGGSLSSGMAIVDTLRLLKPPVRTLAPASAHGAALFVLAAGCKGERAVGTDTALSFAPLVDTAGVPVEAGLVRQIADDIAKLCVLPPLVIAEDLRVGRCMTPLEAVKYGLADRVTAIPGQGDRLD